MPVDVPSNIPLLYEGHITIRISWEFLFGEHPKPDNVSGVGSAMRYGELWEEEIRKAYPRQGIYVSVGPGVTQPLVSLSDDHENPRATIANIARLGNKVYKRRDDWLVERGDDHYRRLDRKYGPRAKKVTFIAPESSPGQYAELTNDQMEAVEDHLAEQRGD